jgi:hypothetical protein
MRLAAGSAPVPVKRGTVNQSRKVSTSLYYSLRSPDSSVGIATRYGLDGSVYIPGGGKIFLFSIVTDRFWGSLGIGGDLPAGKAAVA